MVWGRVAQETCFMFMGAEEKAERSTDLPSRFLPLILLLQRAISLKNSQQMSGRRYVCQPGEKKR